MRGGTGGSHERTRALRAWPYKGQGRSACPNPPARRGHAPLPRSPPFAGISPSSFPVEAIQPAASLLAAGLAGRRAGRAHQRAKGSETPCGKVRPDTKPTLKPSSCYGRFEPISDICAGRSKRTCSMSGRPQADSRMRPCRRIAAHPKRSLSIIGNARVVDDWEYKVGRYYSGGNTDMFASNHPRRSPPPYRFIACSDGCPVIKNRTPWWFCCSLRIALIGPLSWRRMFK